MLKELNELMGKIAVIKLGDLYVECRIEDIRVVYGVTQIQVSPMCGAGKTWKNLTGVIEIKKGF